MANITASFLQVHPNYTMPEAILQYEQASGFIETLGGADLQTRIGTEDLYVYANVFDIRTKNAAGQSAGNALPSCTITAQQISTPTYLIRSRAEYDHHDIAAFAQWKQSLPEAQRLGNRQGFFQTIRNAALYGFNPPNGEGLVNAAGSTSVTLPPDTFSNDTVVTYDNGEMAQFLQQQIVLAKTRMNQLGMPNRVVILGPQRVLGWWQFNIVQLTSAQRPGAGFLTTMGTVSEVEKEVGDTFEWGYDDTMIGKGANGTDLVLIVIPEIKKPDGGKINTSEFAQLTPGLAATTLQFCDMAAPREIPVPLPGGATDVTFEQRITSGWAVRPEAITNISMQYS